MGPLVPWEWLWHLAHLAPRKAFRRLRPGGVEWRSLKVWYPSPGTVARVFRPAFRKHRLSALGALLPTSEAGSLAARFPRVARGIARLERRLERLPPLPWLADHYVLELERNA